LYLSPLPQSPKNPSLAAGFYGVRWIVLNPFFCYDVVLEKELRKEVQRRGQVEAENAALKEQLNELLLKNEQLGVQLEEQARSILEISVVRTLSFFFS